MPPTSVPPTRVTIAEAPASGPPSGPSTWSAMRPGRRRVRTTGGPPGIVPLWTAKPALSERASGERVLSRLGLQLKSSVRSDVATDDTAARAALPGIEGHKSPADRLLRLLVEHDAGHGDACEAQLRHMGIGIGDLHRPHRVV